MICAIAFFLGAGLGWALCIWYGRFEIRRIFREYQNLVDGDSGDLSSDRKPFANKDPS